MKKSYIILGIMPTFILALNISEAHAQRKNSTTKDIPVEVVEVMEISEEIVTTPNCPCKNDENCNCMNKKMQKHDNMMKHEKKMKKKMAEIDEHYNKAIKKIDESDFTDAQKDLLKSQALENKNLAERQLKERTDTIMQHRKSNMEMMHKAHENKKDKKALKEIKEILD